MTAFQWGLLAGGLFGLWGSIVRNRFHNEGRFSFSGVHLLATTASTAMSALMGGFIGYLIGWMTR